MSMAPRRTAALLAAVLSAAALTSCASSIGARPDAIGNGVNPALLPEGAQVAPFDPAPATDNSCYGGHPTASLAPSGPLPPPGDMPAGSYMAAIQHRGYLIAGVDQNTYLWGYRDPVKNQFEGFDTDMVRQVADAIFGDSSPRHLHFVVVPNTERSSEVAGGSVDIVAETMTITCSREVQVPKGQPPVDFSTEYYDAAQDVLVERGSPVTSEQTLAGQRVCATAGSTSLRNLASLQVSLHLDPPMQLWQVPNHTDCLVMLQQGQVDAISTDDTILQGLAAQDPQLKLVGLRIHDEPYGMAISKAHPDFTRFVNAVLAQETADGKWATIWRTWLKTQPPPPPTPLYRD